MESHDFRPGGHVVAPRQGFGRNPPGPEECPFFIGLSIDQSDAGLDLPAHHVAIVFQNARLSESATAESLTGLLRREAILETLDRSCIVVIVPAVKSPADPLPTEIRRLPEDKRLRLTWSDGHVGEYDYRYLRGYCPCAACQGHTAEAIRFHAPAASDVDPWTIEPVGNYAISIHWSDGHGTGIYRFDFLRRLCPCDACAEERGGGDGPPPVEP